MKHFYSQQPEYLGHGACNEASVVKGEHYRFTVLTPNLLRLEYSEDGVFEDRPSQVVLNRTFATPEFHVVDEEGRLEISTVAFHLVYNKKEFAPENLYIDAKNSYTNYGGRWKYGATTYGNPPRHHNLLGTTRTLDKIDGEYPLDFGLQDTSGRSFFDDSKSLLFNEEGWLETRREGNSDVYFLCYQHDYMGAIRDFYRLTGAPPMMPRYAFGNWWSRYWKYTEESYSALLDKFKEKKMPFTVAMLDMDWHVTEVDPKYGRGWTGYTWNKNFFPDPARFLSSLHQKGMHCGLNLHPADGVQGFEDAYPAIAKEMGVDTSREDPVNFDIASTKFVKAYFKHLIHTNEDMGADFWWIDWQQGKESGIKGLDPLWGLNHFHYLDNCKKDRRGMILSRFAGLGSHRYPFGFSGDTIATWKSLAFQPYFTANATNVGYTCWSHDIGGFKTGVRERELFIRWIQFGVFSPVLRMHSSNNPFTSKEPWAYGKHTEEIVSRYFRLRHRLIPYLYTGAYRANVELTPMITPLYYYYPDSKKALEYRNQYFFGRELMVCPLTTPTAFDSDMATVEAWIPKGIWTDIFTGKTYRGDRVMKLNRRVEDQAVLARPGAILPLSKDAGGENSVENPREIDLYIFPGASGSYELYEDSGDGYDYQNGKCAFTRFDFAWGETASLSISARGELSLVPETRSYTLHFRGFAEGIKASGDKVISQSYDASTNTLSVTLAPVDTVAGACVTVENVKADENKAFKQDVFEFLMAAQLPVDDKNAIYDVYKKAPCKEEIALGLNNLKLSDSIRDALYELTFC
ncbi:MAG: DUF5110 domain-containing protein [Ruminococcaceae bacterium]|nr:DUF5110 domain-containing protein [Oscillospiraceae bacterium]